MAKRGRVEFIVQQVPSVFREGKRLRKWISAVARDHGHSIGELNYVLMSDKELLRYNRDFLGHDEYTDVITFDGQTGTGVSGDVLMSLDRIKENAKNFGVSVQQELRRVMVHGLLHLLGHNDKSAARRKAMSALEDKYLARY
jgi:probable rRNA maturation factor